MNIPKEVKTRSVVFLLACMLIVSSVSVYYAFSASTPTSGLTDIYIEPPMMEASYIIGFYTSPSTCYLKNGTTGQIATTGSFATVLQAAINSLTSGGKIFIRAGQYTLTTAITIGGTSKSCIYIEGEGLGGVGAPGVEIDYGLSDLGDTMITYGLTTRNFLGGIKGIMFRGNNTVSSKGLNIQGWISDLFFEECGWMNFDTGVVLQGGSTGVGEAKIWNIWFERCLFEDNLGAGIYFTNTDNALLRMIDRVKIYQCHFYNNRNSIYVAQDAPYLWHISFTDNTVMNERNACINVSYGGGGRQWIIANNHIYDCGIGANGTMAGIYINGSYLVTYPDSWIINNNIIANHFTSSPLALNNSLWFTGKVRNINVQGNFFYTNVSTSAVRLDGLNRTEDPNLYFRDNVGFVTENSGTLTNCVNATWIPHGLAGNPDTNGSITLSLRDNIYFNATILYNVPTVIATNTTHFQIQFTIYLTTTWAIHPVTTVEKSTVYWFATYKP